MESYRRALKLAARGSYLHHQLQEQILRGFQQRHEDQKLETEARKILEGQPRHRTALRLLAELLARRPGKLGEALTVYERYLKVVPSDSKVRETVMFMLVGSNRTRDALPHARALYQESPGAARRLLEYTGLLSLTGDREGAGKVLRKAIASFRRDDSTLPLIVEALDGSTTARGPGSRSMRCSGCRGAQRALLLAHGRRLWQRGSHDDALRFWGKSLGAAPDALAYEQWVEVVLSEGAHDQDRRAGPARRGGGAGPQALPRPRRAAHAQAAAGPALIAGPTLASSPTWGRPGARPGGYGQAPPDGVDPALP